MKNFRELEIVYSLICLHSVDTWKKNPSSCMIKIHKLYPRQHTSICKNLNEKEESVPEGSVWKTQPHSCTRSRAKRGQQCDHLEGIQHQRVLLSRFIQGPPPHRADVDRGRWRNATFSSGPLYPSLQTLKIKCCFIKWVPEAFLWGQGTLPQLSALPGVTSTR